MIRPPERAANHSLNRQIRGAFTMRCEYAVSEGEKMTTNKELLGLRTANTPRGVGTQTNIFADRARNAEIWDVEGNHYIDLVAGIAVGDTIQKLSGTITRKAG